jgi:hypothetical protein
MMYIQINNGYGKYTCFYKAIQGISATTYDKSVFFVVVVAGEMSVSIFDLSKGVAEDLVDRITANIVADQPCTWDGKRLIPLPRLAK